MTRRTNKRKPTITKGQAEAIVKQARSFMPILNGPVVFNVEHSSMMGSDFGFHVVGVARHGGSTAPQAKMFTIKEAKAFIEAVRNGTAPLSLEPEPRMSREEGVRTFFVLAEKNGITIDKRENWRARNGLV